MLGKQHTNNEVIEKQIKFMTIKEFLQTYGLTTSADLVGYEMSKNTIDWMQPARDRFVLLTPTTLKFYGLEV